MQRHGLLGIADSLELEQRLAEEAAGRLACGQLDLDGRERDQRVEEVDAGRQPLERGHAHRPRLLPAPEQEQRVRRVAAQEVAVHGLEAGGLGGLDPRRCDRDGFLVPAGQLEDRGQVGVDAEELVEVAELLGHRPSVGQHRQGRLRVGPPAERDPERRRGVQLPAARRRIARPGDPDRVARESIGLGERAFEHEHLRQSGDDGRARRGRRRGNEIDCTTPGGERALRVPGDPAELGQPVVDETEPDPVAASVRGCDRRIEVGGSADRPTGSERRLGRARVHLGRWQHRRVAPASTAVARRARRSRCRRRSPARAPPARRAAHRSRRRHRPRRSRHFAPRPGRERSGSGAWRRTAGLRVLARPRRDGGCASTAAGRPRSPGRRARGGAPGPHRPRGRTRTRWPRRGRAARSASRTPSPRRGPWDDRGGPLVSVGLERFGDRCQVRSLQRPPGRGQQAQHPSRLRRAGADPREDQILER